jgi:hypothetical protein
MDKTQINKRVQARYDFLMEQGKHGHYETMFKCVHEELAIQAQALAEREAQAVQREREAARGLAKFASAIIEQFFDGVSPDGFELQDMLEYYGLVEKQIATEENRNDWENIEDVELGDNWFKKAPLLATYNDNRKG